MNYKKLLSVLGIMIIIGLVVIFFMSKKDLPQVPTEPIKQKIEQEKLKQDESVPVKKEIESDEIKAEEFIKEEVTDTSFLKNALADGDENACHSIKDQKTRLRCFDSISLSKALELGELTLCDDIEDVVTKGYCKDQIFLKEYKDSGDVSACNKIANKILQKKCFKKVDEKAFLDASSAEDCQNIKDESVRVECEARFKMQEKNLTVDSCENIQDEKLQYECKDKARMTNAIQNNDQKECLKINDKKDRENCKLTIAEKKQLTWAKNIAQEGDAKNCAAIINKSLKAKCVDKANLAAMKKYKDLSYCEKIEDQKIKSQCLKETAKMNMYWLLKAKKEKKSEFCERITEELLKAKCESEF